MKKVIITKISEWGNGYGIRLPKAFVDEVSLLKNHKLEVTMRDNLSMLIKKSDEQKAITKEWFRKAIKKMAKIKKDDKHELIDWGKPLGNEIW